MFRSLRVRNYRLYASASLVSNTGTWMQRIGQDWLVLELSHDNGVALGLITAEAAGHLPGASRTVLTWYGFIRAVNERFGDSSDGYSPILSLLGIEPKREAIAQREHFDPRRHRSIPLPVRSAEALTD